MAITQCDRIMRHLKDYGSITSLEAVNEYGIMRLASRMISRQKGSPLFRKPKQERTVMVKQHTLPFIG